MIIKRQKGTKYHNKKVEFGGLSFDSKKEMQRYLVLKEAQDKGIISDLQRQVKFELIPAIKETYIEHLKTKDKVKERTIQLAITYTCDFLYKKDGKTIIEDVKAASFMIPKEFVIKEKLFRWKYGFPIRRIYKATEEI